MTDQQQGGGRGRQQQVPPLSPEQQEFYLERERWIFENRYELAHEFLAWWHETGGTHIGRTVAQGFDRWSGQRLHLLAPDGLEFHEVPLLPQERAALLWGVTHVHNGKRRIRLAYGSKLDKWLSPREPTARPSQHDIARLSNGGDLSHLVPHEDDPPELKAQGYESRVRDIAVALGYMSEDGGPAVHSMPDVPPESYEPLTEEQTRGETWVEDVEDGDPEEPPF